MVSFWQILSEIFKTWVLMCWIFLLYLTFLSWKNTPELRKSKTHLDFESNGGIRPITHFCRKVRIYLKCTSAHRSHLKVQRVKNWKKKKKNTEMCWMLNIALLEHIHGSHSRPAFGKSSLKESRCNMHAVPPGFYIPQVCNGYRAYPYFKPLIKTWSRLCVYLIYKPSWPIVYAY